MTLPEFLTLLFGAAVWGAVCAYIGREWGMDKGWNDCRELYRPEADIHDPDSAGA